MRIKLLLKLSLMLVLLGILFFNACKKHNSGSTTTLGCDTVSIQQLLFNGVSWQPLFSGASQTSTYIVIGSSIDYTGDQFWLQIPKASIVSGQTYNASILSGYSIIRSGVNYTITSGTITIKQLTDHCLKIIFNLQLNGGNSISNGYMIAGF